MVLFSNKGLLYQANAEAEPEADADADPEPVPNPNAAKVLGTPVLGRRPDYPINPAYPVPRPSYGPG